MRSRILVVEDNRDLAENLRELLEGLGADVRLCASAQEATRAAAGAPFDLAVVDVSLPGGASGLSLVPELRRTSPAAEVVLVTGQATLGSAVEAVRHGVFAYVQKPFDPENLVSLCERALAQVSLRHERGELAKELARSEALYRAVVDTVDALIVGLDSSGVVRIWNHSAATTTGWPAEEAVGRDACDLLLLPEHRGALAASMAEARRSGEAELEVPIRRRDGAKRIVRWRLTPLGEGAPQDLVVAVGPDVTEHLELETRAAEAVAMAAMGRLTAGLAHEIRNPLNAALLQLELIARAARRLPEVEPRQKIEERATIIKSELSRLSLLLDDFLGLARPSHFALEPTDVGKLLQEVLAVQSPVAREAGIELSLRVDPATPFVRGDAAKLKQALVNLIVNAIDAMRERGSGHVRLSAEPAAPDEVEIAIADDGPGLPAQPPQELFQPFVTTKKQGTGLGLPIVKKIVDVHGGTIALERREGGGTVARMHLKAARISVLPGGA